METKNHDTVSDKLLPCPFCGNQPIWYRIGNEYSRLQKVVIKCEKCGIQRIDGICNNKRHTIEWLEDVAIKKWNQRTNK